MYDCSRRLQYVVQVSDARLYDLEAPLEEPSLSLLSDYRDQTVQKEVCIIKGEFKGVFGRVVDRRNNLVNVRLESNSTIQSLGIESLVLT